MWRGRRSPLRPSSQQRPSSPAIDFPRTRGSAGGVAPPAEAAGAVLLGMRRRLDRPAGIGAERIVDEKRPTSVRQPAVHLHAVVLPPPPLAAAAGPGYTTPEAGH